MAQPGADLASITDGVRFGSSEGIACPRGGGGVDAGGRSRCERCERLGSDAMGSISGVDRPIKTFDHRGGSIRFTLWSMSCRAPAERTNSADSARAEVEALRAALAAAEAKVSDAQVQITALKLMIEKLRRALYGRRSERKERLLGQLELELDELTASATEDDLTAETAPQRTTGVKGLERRRASRKPFPEHLARERVVVAAPSSCGCCGSRRLSKVGEDVTETLEVIPRRWKVIETVREKFSCRDCEKLSQAPAPYHAVPRGWAGPNLLATIVYEKYGQHQPLNRQSERYAREGVELSVSTLADQVGACTFALRPLHELIGAHVIAAQRLHGDDTPVPVLAKGKTDTARAWVYVRDDAPFAGADTACSTASSTAMWECDSVPLMCFDRFVLSVPRYPRPSATIASVLTSIARRRNGSSSTNRCRYHVTHIASKAVGKATMTGHPTVFLCVSSHA